MSTWDRVAIDKKIAQIAREKGQEVNKTDRGCYLVLIN